MEHHLEKQKNQHGSSFQEGELTLRRLDLMSSLSQVREVAVMGADFSPDTTLIRGRLNEMRSPSGLFVHATDTIEAHDLTKAWDMRPALIIAIILEGRLQISLDDKIVDLEAVGKPAGKFWNLRETTRVTRRSTEGTHIRKVIIGLPPSWVDMLLDDFSAPEATAPRALTEHRFAGSWTPSAHILALAEQLVNQKRQQQSLQILTAESRSAEIAREAVCEIISAGQPTQPTATTRESLRAQSIRRHLQDHLYEKLSLSGLSQTLGMSVGSMQGAFKRTYQKTIGDFIREERLNAARQSIARDGLSVSQAAYQACYDSPASFSTAFKRKFGISPSDAKA